MSKMSALEAYKIKIVLEDVSRKAILEENDQLLGRLL